MTEDERKRRQADAEALAKDGRVIRVPIVLMDGMQRAVGEQLRDATLANDGPNVERLADGASRLTLSDGSLVVTWANGRSTYCDADGRQSKRLSGPQLEHMTGSNGTRAQDRAQAFRDAANEARTQAWRG